MIFEKFSVYMRKPFAIDAEEKKSPEQNMSNGAIFLCVLTISFIIVCSQSEKKMYASKLRHERIVRR